jgi:hypothetical protein
MLTTAQFTIAKTWNLPRYLPIDESIKKMQFIQKMEYYPTKKE